MVSNHVIKKLSLCRAHSPVDAIITTFELFFNFFVNGGAANDAALLAIFHHLKHFTAL